MGAAGGVQIDFTPLGARRCLGLPMDELTNRVVALEDVLGPEAPELVERLQEAPGWRERFALLDAALLRRVAAGPAPAPEVAWTFRRLAAADGRLRDRPAGERGRLEPPPPRRALAARRRPRPEGRRARPALRARACG